MIIKEMKKLFCKHVYREYIESSELEEGRIKVVMCKRCKKIKERHIEK